MTSDGNILSNEEHLRYQRHYVLPDFGTEGQLKLKNSSILVVGAGGLGSPVLLYLAAAGVGKIGIIDSDKLEVSNLQRQILFSSDDIGKSKALVASEKIKKLNPYIQVTPYNEKLSTSNALEIISNYDLIIDGTDNFATRYLINDACCLEGKPFIYGSIFRYEGQVAVFNFKRGPTYRDLFPEPPEPESVPSCETGGVLGVLPGIIGSIQANEAIKILAEIGEPLAGKLLIINSLNLESRIITIPKISNAPKIEQLINYEQFCGVTNQSDVMVKEITVSDLKAMMDAKEDFQLIDVREQHEFDIANLAGELIPLGTIPDASDKIATDKKVIIHCRSGARSAQAVEYLQQKLGTDNLYNLKGGILAWSDQIDPSLPKY